MEHDDVIRQWLDELTDVSEIDIPRDPDSDDSDTEQPNNSDGTTVTANYQEMRKTLIHQFILHLSMLGETMLHYGTYIRRHNRGIEEKEI
ncbi:hypothetical protein C0J52_06133 [Blattella germanica]|nr:hypothetical protein C0J52_06133 [Blattella germanica]